MRCWSITSHSVGPKVRPMASRSSLAERNTAAVMSVLSVTLSGTLARHRNDLPGHVAGKVTRQEHDDVGDLPHLGGTSEGLAALKLAQELIARHPVEECMHRDARRHGIDAHAVLGGLDSRT